MKALTGCLFIASLANTGVAEVYFGGGIGRTDFDTSLVDDSTGFNLRGGWQYNPYIAFEASYWDTATLTIWALATYLPMRFCLVGDLALT